MVKRRFPPLKKKVALALVEKVLAEFTSGLGNGVFGIGLFVFVVNGEVAIKLAEFAVDSAAILPPCGRPEPVAVKVAVSYEVPVALIKIFVVFAELVPHLKLERPLTLIIL